jgi:hypothetical protein
MKVSRGTAAYYGPTEFKSNSYEQCDQVTKPRDHSYASRMPAVGDLVRCPFLTYRSAGQQS